MHTTHYARKIALPGCQPVADGIGSTSAVRVPLHRLLPIAITVCVLSLFMLNARQAPLADRDELSLLQTMAVTDENAQLQLGLAYRDGRLGLKTDSAQASYWLQRAAEGGNSYAKQLLDNDKAKPAQAVSFGSEMARMPLQQSIEHLKSLAASGDNRAQFELAMRYRDGSWGVERNPALYHEWLEKSAAAGNEVARQELNNIKTAYN